MDKRTSLYRRAQLEKNLHIAWRHIRTNGIGSLSEQTRKEVKEFSDNAYQNLKRIHKQLHSISFVFPPSRGIPQKRPGKSARPIVKSPIVSRIVQRSILDVLQQHEPLKRFIKTPTSFGGIEKRGVRTALQAANSAMQSGCKYYIQSDIKQFFTKIPKRTVIDLIANTTDDEKFIGLLEQAINVELENLEELREKKDEFPIYEIGVAQGSCLSPFLGNILLSEFDLEMNKGDIVCLRYIDDFILFGPTLKSVNAAFKRAQRLLAKHGLEAYDPDQKEKAKRGAIKDGFSFLGCETRPGIIRPSKESQERFLKKIDKIFKESQSQMKSPSLLVRRKNSLIESLVKVSEIARGWGNQYSFCNDSQVLECLDAEIDQRIREHLGRYTRARKRHNSKEDHRRLLGVWFLQDCKKEPIISP
jgi:retron-type reverse transcriptase